MDARRRMTLAAYDNNSQQPPQQNQQFSGIPVPSSALKKSGVLASSAYGRQSLAPNMHGSLGMGMGMSMGPGTNMGMGMGSGQEGGGGGGRGMNRQSLAPTRGAAGMRQSMAAGYGGMGMGGEPLSHSQGSEYSQANPPQTETRNRMYSSVASGGRGDAGYLRASTAVGRDYAPPSVRRSSTFGNRQSSLPQTPAVTPGLDNNLPATAAGPGNAARLAKDPRPGREQQYRERCAEELRQFLAANNFPGPAPHWKNGPSTREFQAWFKFLYSIFDPVHKFGERYREGKEEKERKFEDEVVPLLRDMGYPWAEQIKKPDLNMPGGMGWNNLLPMLHWMATVAETTSRAFEEYPELHVEPDRVTEFEDGNQDRPQAKLEFWIKFLSDAYPVFLDCDDGDFDEASDVHVKALEARFEKYTEESRLRIQQTQTEIHEMKAHNDMLENAPSGLAAAQAVYASLKHDHKQLTHYAENVKNKASKLAEAIKALDEEVAKKKTQLERLESEQKTLQEQFKAQGLSDQEIDRLTKDRSQLEVDLQTAHTKYNEAIKQREDAEIRGTKVLDTADSFIEVYRQKQVKLYLDTDPLKPSVVEVLKKSGLPEDLDFSQTVQSNAAVPEQICPDCTTYVLPALQTLRDAAIVRRRQVYQEGVEVEKQNADLAYEVDWRTQVKGETTAEYESKSAQLAEKQESLGTELGKMHGEAQGLQSRIAEMKRTMNEGLVEKQHRVSALELEYDKLVKDCQKLRSDTAEELAAELEYVVEYKYSVDSQIAELEAMVGISKAK